MPMNGLTFSPLQIFVFHPRLYIPLGCSFFAKTDATLSVPHVWEVHNNTVVSGGGTWLLLLSLSWEECPSPFFDIMTV